jgi:hypothetical protein
MTVEITINWNFLGEDEDAHLSYATSHVAPAAQEEHEEDSLEDFPFVGSVLPLSSSVIAPGLSMPVPAR